MRRVAVETISSAAEPRRARLRVPVPCGRGVSEIVGQASDRKGFGLAQDRGVLGLLTEEWV